MFKFEFSLDILNHLGRGLYRNFSTVIAEAVSNAWDAEAKKVDIHIDKQSETMTIKDDGKGMSESDFQERFLKIGYSRREDPDNHSKRKILGRKGIGKLAMLSVSKKVIIHSRKSGHKETGGVIDNKRMDKDIEQDKEYSLGEIGGERIFTENATGTYLKFEGIREIINRPEIVRKYLAVLFNFSFSFANDRFEIYLNGEKISPNDLRELHEGTEFVWHIGGEINDISKRFLQAKNIENLDTYKFSYDDKSHEIKGYIASVSKVSFLRVRGGGAEFKAGVHLFVNGRLRQENIFDELGSNRLVMRYLYGEIHVDSLDDDDKSNDIFTSNREGVIRDDPIYQKFLDELRGIQRKVISDWDKWRKKKGEKQFDNTNFGNLKENIRKIINELLSKEDDKLTREFVAKKLKELFPAVSKKKIIICHSSANKKLADKVEQELLNRNFDPDEILYSSSNNEKSKIPITEDIFDYIRKFFVQSWFDNPLAIFVISAEMEQSWGASLEAGAIWVTGAEHWITTEENHRPLQPLHTEKLYLEFDENGEFKNTNDVKRIFDKIKTDYKK